MLFFRLQRCFFKQNLSELDQQTKHVFWGAIPGERKKDVFDILEMILSKSYIPKIWKLEKNKKIISILPFFWLFRSNTHLYENPKPSTKTSRWFQIFLNVHLI